MKTWLDRYQTHITIGLVLFIAIGGIVLMIQQQSDKTATAQNSWKAEEQNWQREKDEMSQQVEQMQKKIDELQSQKTVVAEQTATGTVPGTNTTATTTAGMINLNTADVAALDSLPGIGPSKAQAIINYRNEKGGFKKTTDLKNVKGIGESTFEKLKDKITVN